MATIEDMTLEHYNLFTDDELKAIARGGHCMVEAWLHVRNGDSTVSRWHQSLAKAELTRRIQERDLLAKLDLVELDAFYESGEDYDSLDQTDNF